MKIFMEVGIGIVMLMIVGVGVFQIMQSSTTDPRPQADSEKHYDNGEEYVGEVLSNTSSEIDPESGLILGVKDTSGLASATGDCVQCDRYGNEIPVLKTITPNRARANESIEITGTNLSGLEGDAFVLFERADGKILSLDLNFNPETYSYVAPGTYRTRMSSSGVETWRLTLKNQCPPSGVTLNPYVGEQYECRPTEFTPGTYTVYVAPWGTRSNALTFTVIK